MATKYDGHGVTLNSLKVIDVTLPGWVKQTYEVTLLANLTVKTKKSGALKEVNDITATVEYDPTVIGTLDTANKVWTLTWPNTGGSIAFWGELSAVGDVTLQEDTRATCQVTITVTNLNAAGVETAPVYS